MYVCEAAQRHETEGTQSLGLLPPVLLHARQPEMPRPRRAAERVPGAPGRRPCAPAGGAMSGSWRPRPRSAALALLPALLASGGSAAAAGRALPSVCKGCLLEPLELDYFAGPEAPLGGEPPRLTKPSREEFDWAARLGRALLIENASDGTAFAGWTCEQIAKEFPEARMRREYDWGKNPDDRNLQALGAAEWITKVESGEDSADRLKQDPDAPPFAPFYWGVREHRQGSQPERFCTRITAPAN